MNRKGQVTIFIIIAVFIIAAVALFFIFGPGIKNEFVRGTDNIKLFVDSCIEETTDEVLLRIGEGGGYFFPPEVSTDSGITYYFANKTNYLPNREIIEQEISYYSSELLFFCTKNFADFPGFNISQGEISVETIIEQEEVVFNINYPLGISKGTNAVFIENFEKKIPVRLGIIYDSILELLQKQQNQVGICLSCLSDISLKNDLFVDLLDYNNKTMILIFTDYNSETNGGDFRWIFANEYEREEE